MDIKERNNRNNPFIVPENYFDNFHNDLMLRISKTQHKKSCNSTAKKRFFINLFKQRSYAAASIICAFAMGALLYVSIATERITNNNIAEEYSYEYIDELLDNYSIDDYTFYCYLTDSEF